MKLLIGGSPCTHWSIARTKNRETNEPNQKEKVLSDEWALTLFTCTPGGKTRVVVHCMAAKC